MSAAGMEERYKANRFKNGFRMTEASAAEKEHKDTFTRLAPEQVHRTNYVIAQSHVLPQGEECTVSRSSDEVWELTYADGRKKNLRRSSVGPKGIQLFQPTFDATIKLVKFLDGNRLHVGIKQALLAKHKVAPTSISPPKTRSRKLLDAPDIPTAPEGSGGSSGGGGQPAGGRPMPPRTCSAGRAAAGGTSRSVSSSGEGSGGSSGGGDQPAAGRQTAPRTRSAGRAAAEALAGTGRSSRIMAAAQVLINTPLQPPAASTPAASIAPKKRSRKLDAPVEPAVPEGAAAACDGEEEQQAPRPYKQRKAAHTGRAASPVSADELAGAGSDDEFATPNRRRGGAAAAAAADSGPSTSRRGFSSRSKASTDEEGPANKAKRGRLATVAGVEGPPPSSLLQEEMMALAAAEDDSNAAAAEARAECPAAAAAVGLLAGTQEAAAATAAAPGLLASTEAPAAAAPAAAGGGADAPVSSAGSGSGEPQLQVSEGALMAAGQEEGAESACGVAGFDNGYDTDIEMQPQQVQPVDSISSPTAAADVGLFDGQDCNSWAAEIGPCRLCLGVGAGRGGGGVVVGVGVAAVGLAAFADRPFSSSVDMQGGEEQGWEQQEEDEEGYVVGRYVVEGEVLAAPLWGVQQRAAGAVLPEQDEEESESAVVAFEPQHEPHWRFISASQCG